MTKKESVAETINNLDGLTLGHLFQIVRKIKLTALLSVMALFSSIVGGAYALGRNAEQENTAVMLHSPFAMRLEQDGKKFDFKNLTLIEDPMLTPISEDTIILSLREIRSDFDIIPVGLVVARVDTTELSWPWSMFAWGRLSNTAYAQTSLFNWNGHQGDMRFRENKMGDVFRRTYVDGCILEYKVDAEGRSIPESFRWHKRTH